MNCSARSSNRGHTFNGCPRVTLTRMTTSTMVVTLAGVTYRQLDHWSRQGVFPWHDLTPGSGRRRQWDSDDIRIAGVLRAWIEMVGHSTSTNDLRGLAVVARDHRDGYAIRARTGWHWVAEITVSTGDGRSFCALALNSRADPCTP